MGRGEGREEGVGVERGLGLDVRYMDWGRGSLGMSFIFSGRDLVVVRVVVFLFGLRFFSF